MAILRYEERVRIERANGLRKPDTCVEGDCGCSVYGDDSAYAGKSFADIAETPLRQNAVCPHPKMIVPITGAFVVNETAKEFNPEYRNEGYRLVDANPCDGRVLGVMETVSDAHTSVDIKQARTEVTLTEAVEDTVYDEPTKKRVVRSKVKTDAAAMQPLATNATEAEEIKTVDLQTN